VQEPDATRRDRVLVVEDNESIRLLLSRLLERGGYDVVAVALGEAALEAALDGINVVLLDAGLPDLNGLEVCRRLRAQPETADLPIILLTGRTEIEDRRDGFAAGADDFLTKPFEEAELMARLHRATLSPFRPASS
jgi:DNA-binding response OmpR family regulator